MSKKGFRLFWKSANPVGATVKPMSDFEIKITRDPDDIRQAQRLRFEVFNLEMNEGLKSSYARGLDVDDFDPICDHLIVYDRGRQKAAGTYRLLLGSEARKHFGFYSEREFNLDTIKKLSGELLELGRSCAYKDYREKGLIPLLWQGIVDYVKTHRVRYLFGCASLPTVDPEEVNRFFSLLRERYYAPEEFRVQPLPDKALSGMDKDAAIGDREGLFLRLPSLIKGYLRVGALVCGPPALDLEFGTADFLLLLDITQASDEFLKRFGLSLQGLT